MRALSAAATLPPAASTSKALEAASMSPAPEAAAMRMRSTR
jgi:hypothetical protein